MELEVSLPCSQEPSTGPHPEPDQSSPYHPTLSIIYWKQKYVIGSQSKALLETLESHQIIQEFLYFVWKPYVHYDIHKSKPHVLSQFNSIWTFALFHGIELDFINLWFMVYLTNLWIYEDIATNDD
jgi:hypothetical protein